MYLILDIMTYIFRMQIPPKYLSTFDANHSSAKVWYFQPKYSKFGT